MARLRTMTRLDCSATGRGAWMNTEQSAVGMTRLMLIVLMGLVLAWATSLPDADGGQPSPPGDTTTTSETPKADADEAAANPELTDTSTAETMGPEPVRSMSSFGDIARQTSPSGVPYWDITVGDGVAVAEGCQIDVHMDRWHVSGSLRDSTRDRRDDAIGLMLTAIPRTYRDALIGIKAGGVRRVAVSLPRKPEDEALPPLTVDLLEFYDVDIPVVILPPELTPIHGVKRVVTESGLKYWDIKVGEGEEPEESFTIWFNMSMWLEGGAKLVDASIFHGGAQVARLGGFMPGLVEGMKSMKVGGIRRLEIPPDIGLKDVGRPAVGVPPNATLTYEIELVRFHNPDE